MHACIYTCPIRSSNRACVHNTISYKSSTSKHTKPLSLTHAHTLHACDKVTPDVVVEDVKNKKEKNDTLVVEDVKNKKEKSDKVTPEVVVEDGKNKKDLL